MPYQGKRPDPAPERPAPAPETPSSPGVTTDLGGIFLSLGSNRGDRAGHLQAGLRGLAHLGVRPRAASCIYRTAPVGGPPQGDFLNLVIEVDTGRTPGELLAAAHAVEADRGRDRAREERWGPRTLDVDLLLYRDQVVTTEALTVPHPRLHQRRFVLVPLAELAGDRLHPLLGVTCAQLLAACDDPATVERHAPPPRLASGRGVG